VPKFPKRRRFAILLLILLVPTILFSSVYALGSAYGTSSQRYAPAPGDWSVNMTLTHPGYVIPGQEATMMVKVGVNVPNKNFSLGIGNIAVELRQPLSINSTTGIVGGWAVVSNSFAPIAQNFTGSTSFSRNLTLKIPSLPGSGASDLFIPVNRVAFNAVVFFTVYQQSGGTVTATSQSLSLLDARTFYQTQLSSVVSSSSWLTYQLIAALVFAFLFVRAQPTVSVREQTPYSRTIWRFKRERMLAHLEDLKYKGRIGEQRYSELKDEFKRELNGPLS
jgi:hypothetical protein